MGGGIRSIRLRLRIETRAEIILATAPIYDHEFWYLSREIELARNNEEGCEFFSERGESFYESQVHAFSNQIISKIRCPCRFIDYS